MRGPQGDLGSIAHDLRSALSASVAYTELCQEKLEDGQAVEPADVERVAKALEKLSAALERLQQAADAQKREASA